VSDGPFPPWRASWVTAGCEAQGKAEAFLFHPGTTGEGKAGRVNESESSYAPLSAAPPVGGSSGVEGLAAGKRQAPTREAALIGRTPPPRGKEGTQPGRVSCVRNTETPTESDPST
jgi:hypothetical protein